MAFRFLRPIRYLIRPFTEDRTPRRIAWGIALGICVGLIPKGNLTAGVVAFILFATRVNLGSGLLAALAVSAIAPALDPLTHGIGFRLLRVELLAGLIGSLQNLPVLPWMALNNTVVFGSLALGVVLMYPASRVSECGVVWATPRIADALKRRRSSDNNVHVESDADVTCAEPDRSSGDESNGSTKVDCSGAQRDLPLS